VVNSPLFINIHTLYRLLNTKDCYTSSQTGLTADIFININYLYQQKLVMSLNFTHSISFILDTIFT